MDSHLSAAQSQVAQHPGKLLAERPWRRLGGLPVGLAQMPAQHAQQPPSDGGMGFQERPELGTFQDRDLAVTDGVDRNRARVAVQQSHVSEERAFVEQRQGDLPFAGSSGHDLDRTRQDQEQGIARITLQEQGLSVWQAFEDQPGGQFQTFIIIQMAQDRNRVKPPSQVCGIRFQNLPP
jgi:hypothetical protein